MRYWLLLFSLNSMLLLACSGREERGINSEPTSKNQAAIDSLQALQEEPNRKVDSTAADTLAFSVAFNRFFSALQAADTAAINEFIHPAFGLWIIEQPGAMPKMTRVTAISAFKREYQNRSFFTVAQEVETCELIEETFPKFDCADMDGGKTGFSKDGCFAWESEKFKTSAYWDYASLTKSQLDQVKVSLPFVQQSVLHTNTSFEFHFGFTDGKWYLLFAKLIYPCSA